MSNFFNMIAAAAGSAGATEETDPYYQNTVLHLKGDGNQGANNIYNPGPPKYLAFSDNSDNNFPIIVNGDAYGSNFSPFDLPKKYWSVDFGNGAESLTIGAISPGTVDLTLEFWLKFDGTVNYGGGTTAFIWTCGSKSPYGSIMQITANSSTQIIAFRWGYDIWGGGGPYIEKTTSCPLGEWHHYLWTRSGASAVLYVDGVSVGAGTGYNGWSSSTAAMDGTIYFNEPATNFYFPGGFNGQISNFRLTTNQVLVTGNFTPSTTGLTTTDIGHTGNVAASITGNVEYCVFNSSNFYDTNTNRVIAPNYNAGTQNKSSTLSPFDYDLDIDSGSGRFDGDGDFLTVAADASLNDFGTGEFTIEFWFNTSKTTNQALAGTSVFNSSGWTVELSYSGAGYISFVPAPYQNRIETSSAVFRFNTWNHLAITRNASGTITFWLNGTSVKTTNYTSSISNSANLNIGQFGEGWDARYYFEGYISNARIVKGTSIYNSDFTPSTSPLTAVTNTSLLSCQYSGSVRNVGFIDSSPYQHLITRAGNTTQGTFSPFCKSDGAWANYFNDSTGDYLSLAANAALVPPTSSAFTVECWIYPTGSSANPIFNEIYSGGSNKVALAFNLGSAVANTSGLYPWIGFYSGTAWSGVISDVAVNANEWSHVACVFTGSAVEIYINGSAVATTGSISTWVSVALGDGWRIGKSWTTGAELTGWLSNFRYVNGSAVYSTSFTPSGPLTAITNTVLLACQSNRFVDNSSNAFAITTVGTPKVTPFSPFPITTAYNPSVNGGAGYFDANNGYLTIPYSSTLEFGSADWTVEMWVYVDSTHWASSPAPIINYKSDTNSHYGASFGTNNPGYATLALSTNGGSWAVVSTSTDRMYGDAWNHIAFVRSGANIYIYTNGVRYTASTTYSGNVYIVPNVPVIIGRGGTAGNYQYQFKGSMSGLRVVKGTALYTDASFTPPTTPPTAVSGTNILCNYTNAGIFDNTNSNILQTVGNAQIDTTTKKYGTGSLSFDGTGDNLTIASNPSVWFGSGAFTIEMWLYPNNAASEQMLVAGSDTGSLFLGMNIDGANRIALGRKGVAVDNQVSYTYSTGAWIHLACVRDSSNNIYFFVDGTQVGSTGTNSISFTNSTLNIGFEPTQKYFNGFIDDLRISRIARYTTSFNPPTKAFPKIGV